MWYQNPLNLIYIISFVDLFAIGLTFPLLSTHLRNLGVSHTSIGIISSLYSGIQVISGPVVGGWTDVRDRKTVLKKVLLICGICYGLLGLTDSFLVIVILRVILGIVKHIQSICKAVITDILTNKDQTEAFGKSAAISSFGFILGPFFGGYMSEFKHGFSYVCLLTMLLFFINIVVTSYLPDIPQKRDSTPLITNVENTNVLTQIKSEFSKTIQDLKSVNWHKHWECFSLRFLFGLAMSTYFSNQSLLLKEKYNLSQKHSGFVISYFSSIGMFSAFFLNKMNSFYKNNDILLKLLHQFTLMALSVIAMYISPNLYIFLIVLIPFSVACSSLRIISMEMIIQKTAEKHRGSLSGASNSVMSISRFVTPLVSGIVGDLFSEESVILVAVVPALLGVFLCVHLRVRNKR